VLLSSCLPFALLSVVGIDALLVAIIEGNFNGSLFSGGAADTNEMRALLLTSPIDEITVALIFAIDCFRSVDICF
jgi:hypothetical protein